MPVRPLALALLLFLALGLVGCGPSEGQNVSLYLGSVTIHERRLQVSADELEALVPRLRTVPPDLAGVREKVRALQGALRESKTEVEKLHVPTSAQDLHKQYVEAFEVAAQRMDRLGGLLAEQETLARDGGAAVQSRIEALKGELAELGKRAEALDEQIRLQKIELARKFPEVQVPEADPPAPAAAS